MAENMYVSKLATKYKFVIARTYPFDKIFTYLGTWLQRKDTNIRLVDVLIKYS